MNKVKHFRIFLISSIFLLKAVLLDAQATYTVTNTADAGSGSLRAAITSANAYAGTSTIDFNITGGSVPYSINLTTALPALSKTITIDGTTQPAGGYTGVEPKITVKGNRLSTGISYGFDIVSDAAVIKGMTIRDFYLAAIRLDGNSDDCVIEKNVIYNVGEIGNPTVGHGILNRGGRTIIKGNSIGLNIAAASGLGCTGAGIYIADVRGVEAVIGSNSVPSDINMIAHNGGQGVAVVNGARLNKISGNKIFDNTLGGIRIAISGVGTGNDNIPAPTITSFSAGNVGGTISSSITLGTGATVELFGSNSPQNAMQYIGSTTVTTGTAWSINVGYGGLWTNFVATVTSVAKNTSEFSNHFTTEFSCSFAAIDQTPEIELLQPSNFTDIDPTTYNLQYDINVVPALNYPVTENQYHLRLELAPEIMDPVTGLISPDWASAITVFNTVTSSITPGVYNQAISSFVTPGSVPVNYYWRVGIQYEWYSLGHQPVLWSSVNKFVLQPASLFIPAATYLTNNSLHTNNINWVYGVSYLDNGLTSEGIAYIDGLGKSRQVQSLSNSTNTVMAVEAAYSEEGGGVAMSLPAPITDVAVAGRFGYSYNFFDVFDATSNTWSDFSTDDFDREIKGTSVNTLMSPSAVDETDGVGKYYSMSNTDAYIDAAMGHPYAYNVPYKSPLQRPMLSAAGVGVDFKMTSGKEFKHFYGHPSQEELDRVYSVAIAPMREKISRRITYNPDGVGTISYTDNEGKVIATALTVCNAPSLNALAEDGMEGFTTHVNPLNTDSFDPSTLVKTASSKFFVPCTETAVTVKYDVDLSTFQLNEESPCMDCKYNVEIHILNEATGEEVYQYVNSALVPASTLCPSGTATVNLINTVLTLDGPANYIINRVIKPYVDPTTGESILTTALNAFNDYIETNQAALLSAFTTTYNTQTDYYVLRKQKLVTPTTTYTEPCTLLTSTYSGSSAGSSNDVLSAATYRGPTGITKGDNGEFYIADEGNNVIRNVTTAGNVLLLAGSTSASGFTDGTATAARFNSPNDVAFRPFIGLGSDTYPASVIVADKDNNAIRMVDVSGTTTTGTTTTIATSTDGISAPEGLGIDAFGVIYVASTGNNKIYKINLSSGTPVITQLTIAGGSPVTAFNTPTDISVGTGGILYITDKGSNSLLKMNLAGTLSSVSSSFSNPSSVSAETSGFVFVSNQGNNKISKVNLATNAVVVVAGTGTPGSTDGDISVAKFDSPVGLYAESVSKIYIADTKNNRLRIADLSSCLTVVGTETTYPWYPDQTIITDISYGAYTKELTQLDGDMDLDLQPGDEHYKLKSVSYLASLLPTAPTPYTNVMADFIAAYQRVNWIDLTGQITLMDVYEVGSGSELSQTTISAIDENNALLTSDQQDYFLLKVTYTKPSCSEACQYVDNSMPCSQQCTEQQNALKAEMDAAYAQIIASPTVYFYLGTTHSTAVMVTSHYPLNSYWYNQLTAADKILYDDYENKRQANDLFVPQVCLDLCNGITPSPCEVCAPEYDACVYDHMTYLNAGYQFLIDAWDDPINNPNWDIIAADRELPWVYSDLIHTSGSVTYPDAILAANLGLELLNYLAANLSDPVISERPFWDILGGSCTNCQAAASTSPVCPAAPPMNMNGFPTLLIPILQDLNVDCQTSYNNCLQMNGTAAQQNAFLCAENRDNCIDFYGPAPTPTGLGNPLWVTWNNNITACGTDYTNCLAYTSPTTVDQMREDIILLGLLELYPDPSQAATVSSLLATIISSTSSLTLSQLEQYMVNYVDEQECILDCEQALIDAFNQWIEDLQEEAANNINQIFIDQCYGELEEKLDISYTQTIYHYTLYNYDRANNLVSTVPPEGIDYINLSVPAEYTYLPRWSRAVAHRMLSTYKPTSLHTITTSTPDEGSTRYLYDKAGRLRFSQSSEQAARSSAAGYEIFSYVKYDNEFRVIESGEYRDIPDRICAWSREDCPGGICLCALPDYVLETKVEVANFPNVPGYTFEEMYVVYDVPTLSSGIPCAGYTQTYLQGRVSKTFDRDATTNAISNVTHYSYDAHGRIDHVIQEALAFGSGINKYKSIDYVYQGLSGTIEQIMYQKCKPQEAFYQKYTYDADYRMTKAEVSRDGGATWLATAEYDYYLHGPMKRTGLGNKIQDLDFVYNINGWLKAINNPLPEDPLTNDSNEDATDPTNKFSPDVFAEALNYYHGDYKRTGVGLDNAALTVPQSGTRINGYAKDLFGGSISSSVTNTAFDLSAMSSPPDRILAQAYSYDYLNRLTDVYAEVQPENFTSFRTTGMSTITNYASHISYDANGNILTFLRNTMSRVVGGSTTNEMDNMTYEYAQTTMVGGIPKKINNRLAHVNDAAVDEAGLDDIKDQGAGYVAGTTSTHNYKYDARGRIISDVQAGITSIEWTISDKVKKITKADGTIISFTYNSMHNRLAKKVDPTGANNDVTTMYSYDGNGTLMSTYEFSYNSGASAYQYKLLDHQMYGLGRIGVYDINEVLVSSPGTITNNPAKQYFEISDHLGSIRAVVSGVKTGGGNATILQMTDYHEFGQTMQGRNFVSTAYRFGYQGSDKDAEINSGSYTTEYRALDVRLGRWFSPDPITHPSWSPYVSMNDNPVNLTDVLGLEPDDPPVSGPDDDCDPTNKDDLAYVEWRIEHPQNYSGDGGGYSWDPNASFTFGNVADYLSLMNSTRGTWLNAVEVSDTYPGGPTPWEAAHLAEDIYGGGNPVGGWKKINVVIENVVFNDPDIGFNSAIYERELKDGSCEYSYVTEGTKPVGEGSLNDWGNNLRQFIFGDSKQYKVSIKNAKLLKQVYGDKLYFSGHSLGGGLAIANSKATGNGGYAFNPAPLSTKTIKKEELIYASKIHVYFVEGEIVTNIHQKVGITAEARDYHMLMPTTVVFRNVVTRGIDHMMETVIGSMYIQGYNSISPQAK